jgi:hypothetical protein
MAQLGRETSRRPVAIPITRPQPERTYHGAPPRPAPGGSLMRTADIVLGETYRTTRGDRIMALAFHWHNTGGFSGRLIPGGGGIAVARAGYDRPGEPTGWWPEVVLPQQIDCTEAEYQRRLALRDEHDAVIRATREAARRDWDLLRDRILALPGVRPLGTSHLRFMEWSVEVDVATFRTLVELAEGQR